MGKVLYEELISQKWTIYFIPGWSLKISIQKVVLYWLYNNHTKIQQNIQPIDFVNQLTDKTFTDIDTMGAVACQGGACEITF